MAPRTPSSPTSLTRREFTASAVLAALATACARVAPPAQGPAPTTPAGTPAAGAPSAQPDPNAPVADALLSVVVARYGQFIAEADRPKVRDGILQRVRLANRLRAFAALPNSADPYSVCVNAQEEAR